MDEIASWYIQIKLKTAGLTSQLNTRFLKPVYCDKGKILVSAIINKKRRNLIDVETAIYDGSGDLCSQGLITYFTFSEKIAKEKFYYPDFNSFFED